MNRNYVSLCRICHRDSFEVLASGLTSVYDRQNVYSVQKCVSCGVSQTIPFPDLERLTEIYSNSYAYEMHSLVKFEKRRRAKFLVKLLKTHTKNSSVLEFGCGEGILLKELEKNAFTVAGVERSEGVTKKLESDFPNASIYSGTVEDFLLNQETTDKTIIFSHTLEHLTNPLETLERLGAYMTAGSDLLIVVPNLEIGLRAWNKKNWGYWQVPVHTYHFDCQSLESLLERSGFEVVKVWKRNKDFLSFALYFSNVLKISGERVSINGFSRFLLQTFSFVWSYTHPYGSDDLVLLAKRL